MELWALRLVWASLPVTAGPAASGVLDPWSTTPRVVASILLWAVWAVGLLAVVAPRPAGLTALRVVAPCLALLAIVVALTGAGSATADAAAVVASLAAAALASSRSFAMASANGVAYGDERRYPVVTPPALYLGPLPLARLLLGAAVATGPLLLADGRVLPGALAIGLGLVAVPVLARALHSLSVRWVVLVPAGLVVVDPMTLADAVLFPRDHITALRPAPRAPAPDDVLDLRLGATSGSVSLALAEEAELLRARVARRGGDRVETRELWIAVARRAELLRTAGARRIRTGAERAT